MASPLTPDAASEIRWALWKLPNLSHYIERLGLPQADTKKGTKGKPVFNGKASKRCDALYQSVKNLAKQLQARFGTKEDLRTADARKHADLMVAFVEPLLLEYGHDLWSPAEPYSTQNSPPEPEQFLKCDNAEDRARIVLYIYCWILLHVYRELPGRNLNSGHQYDNGAASAASSDTNDNSTQQRLHQVTDKVLSNNGRSEAGSSRNRLMPVAQMLPLSGQTDFKTAPAAIVRRVTNKNTFNTHSIDEGIVYDNDDDADISWEPSGSLPHKRRDYSSAQSSRQSTKRCKTRAELPVRTGVNAKVLRNTRTTRANGEREVEDAVYSSQHVAAQTSSSGIGESCIVGPAQRESATANSVVSAEPLLNDPIERDADGHDVDDDTDSVQGSSRNYPVISSTAETTPADSAAKSSLIVIIKLTAQSQDLEGRRHRLASKILDVLRGGLQRPNVLLLSGLIELLETTSKMDSLRLQEIYGRDLKDRQQALKMWLQCLKRLLSFCEDTGFRGDTTTRNAYLETISDSLRLSAGEGFIHILSSLSAWRAELGVTEEGFARDVASIFFHLAFWKNPWIKLTHIETLTLEFTEELLAWFR